MESAEHEKQEPSPQELNARLNHFFELIPKRHDIENPFPSPTEIDISFERNLKDDEWITYYNEEYEQAYGNKLKKLLDKATITPELKKMIVRDLSSFSKSGISKEYTTSYLNHEFFFLDFDPESGGIFDLKNAIRIERKAIARESLGLQTYKEHGMQWNLDRLNSSNSPNAYEQAKVQTEERYKELEQNLRNWIDHFKEIYHEDIVS